MIWVLCICSIICSFFSFLNPKRIKLGQVEIDFKEWMMKNVEVVPPGARGFLRINGKMLMVISDN